MSKILLKKGRENGTENNNNLSAMLSLIWTRRDKRSQNIKFKYKI